MNDFDYVRATSVSDALHHMRADPSAKFIAGGTNLVDLIKEHVERPSRVIDITHLPLTKVEETAGGGLRIGALVPNRSRLSSVHLGTLSAARKRDPRRRLAAIT
jgi:xanthine dehydrogenase YagS FAD-binding subunit